jgi:O2-independent ubiquinone biosynthesis accessory factor UbiT
MKSYVSTGALPELPPVMRIPLTWIPSPLKVTAITRAMNTIFAVPLEAGELDFLAQRVMNILVADAKLSFSLRLDQDKLQAGDAAADADLTIEGNIYTFLLLATRKEDPDTLFFRRQLKTSGDTELGLNVKNFLAGLEPDALPGHLFIDPILHKSLALADRIDEIRGRLLHMRSFRPF